MQNLQLLKLLKAFKAANGVLGLSTREAGREKENGDTQEREQQLLLALKSLSILQTPTTHNTALSEAQSDSSEYWPNGFSEFRFKDQKFAEKAN